MFRPNFNKVLDNYNTGISSGNLQMAFQKVDEVKNIAQDAVRGMVANTGETEKLLQDSQEVQMLAKDFQSNAADLEHIMKNQNWWAFSKPCILTFAAGGGLCVIVVIVLYILMKLII